MTSPPAGSPTLNVADLNFDTCERLRHLDWLMTQLGVPRDARVLDVGGYPGYFARGFPERRIVTADTYAKGHPPYVKASGAALPFADNAFEVTVACDVLEHVPGEFRRAFLTELARVSSMVVIIAGPYTTPGTARAEQTVRGFLPESSPAQMWLAEHEECGLPSMEETAGILKGAGVGADVYALPVGTLTEWMLFFAAQAAGERNHQTAKAVTEFIAQFNRLHMAEELSFSSPAYRHSVVAAIAPTIRERAALIFAVDGQSASALHERFDRKQVEEYVTALGQLLQRVFTGSEPARFAEDGSDAIRMEYITRLEMMLSHREGELPAGVNDTYDSGDPLPRRLRRAWQMLLGRPPLA